MNKISAFALMALPAVQLSYLESVRDVMQAWAEERLLSPANWDGYQQRCHGNGGLRLVSRRCLIPLPLTLSPFPGSFVSAHEKLGELF